MYKYYLEFNIEEHMLNPYEVACRYRILSKNKKPHGHFVARLLKEYCITNEIPEKFYYRTSKGEMMLVYPFKLYDKVMKELFDKYEQNVLVHMEFDNKTHYFILEGDDQYVQGERSS